MSVHSFTPQPVRPKLDRCDPVWDRVRDEAEAIVRKDVALASFVIANVLNHDTLESAVVHRIAARLDHGALPERPRRPELHGGAAARSLPSARPSAPTSWP